MNIERHNAFHEVIDLMDRTLEYWHETNSTNRFIDADVIESIKDKGIDQALGKLNRECSVTVLDVIAGIRHRIIELMNNGPEELNRTGGETPNE